MVKKALVVFALKEEFDPWKRRHQFRPLPDSPHPVSIALIGDTEAYVALAGVGARAAERIGDITACIEPNYAIMTGVAAGLKSDSRSGEVLVATETRELASEQGITTDPELLRKAVESGARLVPTFLTVPRIVRTVEEKIRLGLNADVADMESLPMMSLWAAHVIPALSLRVVLDPVNTPMAFDFESAMNNEGQIRKAKIVGQLLRSPKLLPSLIHLANQNRRALRNLADFLDRFLSS
jgi:hypothetical protein